MQGHGESQRRGWRKRYKRTFNVETVFAATMRFDRERVDAYPDSAHIIYRNIASVLSARLDVSSEMLTDLVLRTGEAPIG